MASIIVCGSLYAMGHSSRVSLSHRCGVDAFHALLEGGKGEAVLRLRAAEKPSRAVGSALVPVVVAEFLCR